MNPILLDALDRYGFGRMIVFSVWENVGATIINSAVLRRLEITR